MFQSPFAWGLHGVLSERKGRGAARPEGNLGGVVHDRGGSGDSRTLQAPGSSALMPCNSLTRDSHLELPRRRAPEHWARGLSHDPRPRGEAASVRNRSSTYRLHQLGCAGTQLHKGPSSDTHGTKKRSALTESDLSTSQAGRGRGAYEIYLEEGKKRTVTHILCFEGTSHCDPLCKWASKLGFLPSTFFAEVPGRRWHLKIHTRAHTHTPAFGPTSCK